MSRTPTGESTAVIAVDTGGTFTDLLLFHDGAVRGLKVPSSPSDPSRAILEGVAQLLRNDGATTDARPSPDRVPYLLLHGSTVATNALLERKGARVVLVTNQGFEDILEIGRQNRPQLYALVGHRRPPLVDRSHRLGIRGRLGPDGEEVTALETEELAALAHRVRDGESIAICLLHSYADPRHEEAVAAALEGLSLPLSVSSRLLPEYREYEGTWGGSPPSPGPAGWPSWDRAVACWRWRERSRNRCTRSSRDRREASWVRSNGLAGRGWRES